VACEDFLTNNPISPDVLFNLGGYYQQAGRIDDAVSIYQGYLALGDLGDKHDKVKEILESLKPE
jgi:hypothetical protein